MEKNSERAGTARSGGGAAPAPRESSETQRLAAALARLSQPIVVINARHLIVTVNPAIGNLFGYRLDELKGKPVSMLIAERDRQKHDEHIRLHANGGDAKRVQQHPCRIAGRRADGSEFPAEATVARTRLTTRPILTVMLRDVTEDVVVEKTLQANYELLDRIFATTHFCIVSLDRDLNFVRVNRAYADACGQPPEFFVGKNHFDLYPNPENQAIFREVVASGQPFTINAKPFEFPDHPELGVTYWDWTLHPLKDGDGQVDGLLFELLDVTRQVRAMQ